ncbi:hypothetical protein C0Q70_01032 [Pomacea canaliculata]|uniref:Receptor ligand binding region domain-containing protein n=1 Tax=Pomacea canaliculata TaxID=400727 RepID=A0A2T7PYE7_POMCA|nr:hypothetical protein C0Q70_01032 [Pomacea canaliculata]
MNHLTSRSPEKNAARASVCLVPRGAEAASPARKLLIGYLPIDKTHDVNVLVERQYRVISGALTYAIETIKHDKVLPTGYSLDFVWNDTHGTISGGLSALTDQWRQGVDIRSVLSLVLRKRVYWLEMLGGSIHSPD